MFLFKVTSFDVEFMRKDGNLSKINFADGLIPHRV